MARAACNRLPNRDLGLGNRLPNGLPNHGPRLPNGLGLGWLGWGACATLPAQKEKLARSVHLPLEGGVGGRVPRSRPKAGHSPCFSLTTLVPLQVQVCRKYQR